MKAFTNTGLTVNSKALAFISALQEAVYANDCVEAVEQISIPEPLASRLGFPSNTSGYVAAGGPVRIQITKGDFIAIHLTMPQPDSFNAQEFLEENRGLMEDLAKQEEVEKKGKAK